MMAKFWWWLVGLWGICIFNNLHPGSMARFKNTLYTHTHNFIFTTSGTNLPCSYLIALESFSLPTSTSNVRKTGTITY